MSFGLCSVGTLLNCVCNHPGLFVCQSGSWQCRLILGRWITASCSPTEAVDQRERQKDINKQRRGKKKRGIQTEGDTPEGGNKNDKKNKKDRDGDEEKEMFYIFAFSTHDL